MGTKAADAVLGKDEDQVEQTQQTEEEREASEAFEAGFNKVSKKDEAAPANPAANVEGQPAADDTTTTTAEATAKAAADAEAKAKADAEEAARKAADDEWAGVPKIVRDRLESLGEIPNRLRGIEGHIGGLKSKLEGAVATAKAAADKTGTDKPTDAQIAEALANEESFAEFERDFPDFAKPIKAQLTAIRAEVAKIATPTVDTDGVRKQVLEEVGTQISGAVDMAEERAFTRLKHPDWKQVVAAPEFKAWLQAQPEDTKKLAASPLADDAITLIDGFKTHRKTVVDADAARKRKEKRVEDALPATESKGGSGSVDTGLSDEQAFELGFKRVAGKK